MNHSENTSFIWGIACLNRDAFKWGKYQDVILPLTVVHWFDQILVPTKDKGLEIPGRPLLKAAERKGKIQLVDAWFARETQIHGGIYAVRFTPTPQALSLSICP